MAKNKKNEKKPDVDKATRQFKLGLALIASHPIFSVLLPYATIYREGSSVCPHNGWAVTHSNGAIHVHPKRLGAPEEWAYVIAHSLLHLAFAQFEEKQKQQEWNIACCAFVGNFLNDIKFGRAPEDIAGDFKLSVKTEDGLYEDICKNGVPFDLKNRGTAGDTYPDMVTNGPTLKWGVRILDWQKIFARALAEAASSAINVAAGMEPYVGSHRKTNQNTPAKRARQWFIGNYPLFGALAAGFDLIEDAAICNRMNISIAAVNASQREIYINPAAGLSEMECRFTMAHEFLHVGLEHQKRRRGRDAELWNVACDYVINDWLVQMGIGNMPQRGLLHDISLRGMSSEEIYDKIRVDLRRARKLQTLRGTTGCGDMLEGPIPEWWCSGEGTTLDEYYRSALARGLDCHQTMQRGLIPAGLIEEIRALTQPPIKWDVELARWFDHHFPPLERLRSYARPSRRQSCTPDIARPAYVRPEQDSSRTFGVVLDTSGSMDRNLLAQALGAIASYSVARDVPYARVIFCDAYAYDRGYMAPEEIAGKVAVRGRGGTVLQPGIDLIEQAVDFPKKGPVLVITDGWCDDNLHLRREHAFLIPSYATLPFRPKGEVFYME